MTFSSGHACGRHAIPVSADDVARVVARAFSERSSRLRLTAGQRRAILNGPLRPGRATA
jgi:hypothetical protein